MQSPHRGFGKAPETTLSAPPDGILHPTSGQTRDRELGGVAMMGNTALEGLAAPAAFARDEAFMLATADERTDDATRLVSLDRRHVRILRRREGVSMHIGVPSRAYRGVALSLSADERWCITLTHADPELS
eukprot:gene33810-39418_t